MELMVGNKEIVISGKIPRIARLRHEWFEFVDDPTDLIDAFKRERPGADVFTFVRDIYSKRPALPFKEEVDSVAVLTPGGFEKWWKELDFKVRNKIRKAEKTGVEIRNVSLDDEFAAGVEKIYNESPIRQGKKFWHYGKDAATIKKDLSSFPECTSFVGAYLQSELIGFMKLYEGPNVLRTVHIIAKLSHRDKPVQDALIAQGVKMCEQRNIERLQYGSWSTGGLGTFKIKHGFAQVDVARYFVPLNVQGGLLLSLNLHRRLQDQLPEDWKEKLKALRARWNSRLSKDSVPSRVANEGDAVQKVAQ